MEENNSQNQQTKNQDTLLNKILRILIPLSIVPILLSGIILINIAYNSIKKAVSYAQIQTVKMASEDITNFIENKVDMVKCNSDSITVSRMNIWSQELLLKKVHRRSTMFEYLFITDKNGMEIANSNLGVNLKNHADSVIVKGALKGEVKISDVSIVEGEPPLLTICVPINKYGKTVEALCAVLNLRGMWDLIDSIKIGATGNAFVVSEKGNLIAHPDKPRVLRHETVSGIFNPPLSPFSKGGRDNFSSPFSKGGKDNSSKNEVILYEYIDEHGEKMLAAYSTIKRLGWKVIIQQSKKEAYQPAYLMFASSIILLIITFSITVWLSIRFTKSIVSPIEKLVEATDIISSGNLSYKLEMGRRDEIGNMAESFNKMVKKLKDAQNYIIQNEKLAAIGKLAAGISHEIANPLTSLLGYIHAIKLQKGNWNEKIDEYLSEMDGELSRISTIVGGLLDFSRQAKMNLVKANINDLVEKSLTLTKHSLDRFKHVRLETQFNKDVPEVFVDPNQIQQVFINLILNAGDSIVGGGKLRITTECNHIEGDAQYVSIKFSDTGSGIPEEIKDKIFDPFFTTKEVGKGTGLGLSISYGIIQSHGGKIEVISEEGKGTTFTVLLPVTKDN